MFQQDFCHLVRFQVLTTASMKMTLFWDVAPCSHVEASRRLRDAYCLHYLDDDGGSTHLSNVGQSDYTAPNPRRQSSSRIDLSHYIKAIKKFYIFLHLIIFTVCS
jgi:hypothetical protein